MLKPLLPITTLLLIILAALMACTGATPARDPTETPTPNSIAATPALIPNTPGPEATATPATAPTVVRLRGPGEDRDGDWGYGTVSAR